MTETKYTKPGAKKQWHSLVMALNFFILFNGLVIALKNYLTEDRLPLTHYFLLGLISATIGGGLTFILKGKGLNIKIVATTLLLLLVIVLNFLTG